MCGITGIFHYGDTQRSVDRDLLVAMTRTIAHRGPDGEGAWHDGPIGFGHRRLSIIDPSEASRQPMLDDSSQYVITFNGEIYNFRDLRAELESKGHRFSSSGDTEVALIAYKQWGIDVVNRLSGIFALAIWDASEQELFIARDPLGVKPLFYSDDGDTFRFGSEVKAILRDPNVDRSLNPEALDAFLTFGYSPAPATGFHAVSQLLPGHWGMVSRNGFSSSRYWDQPYAANSRDVDFDVARDEFGDLLDEVTKSQMVSDVGIGAFLSGGLDSAAIVRSMSRANHGRVGAVSAGMDWHGFNELEGARATAAMLGVDIAE